MTGTVGVVTPRDALIALNYRRLENWTAKPKVTLCRTLEGTSATTCSDAIIGAPTLGRRHQLEAEVRRQWSAKIAAGLYVTRDLELNSWGVEMPVYFIKDPTGGLVGGVVASYRGDEKRFDVSVFLGDLFKIHK